MRAEGVPRLRRSSSSSWIPGPHGLGSRLVPAIQALTMGKDLRLDNTGSFGAMS